MAGWEMSLKGSNMPAQGNALGSANPKSLQALKGRNRGRAEVYVALSGLGDDVVVAHSQGVALGWHISPPWGSEDPPE